MLGTRFRACMRKMSVLNMRQSLGEARILSPTYMYNIVQESDGLKALQADGNSHQFLVARV